VKKLIILLLVALVLTLTACGSDTKQSASDDTQVLRITMRDNRFTPATVTVSKGKTVRFEFTNDGTVDHEALVGDAAGQMAHEKDMASGDSMGGMHDSDSVTVKPGKTGTLTHTFTTSGDLLIGCHEKGHYMDGMKMTVKVA
jgi:uncharacterized cupredoxin-like copper-binding protein